MSDETPASPLVDLDAERAVLAAALLDAQTALPRLRAVLAAGDFDDARHAALWEALAAIHERGGQVDYVTLAAELRAAGRLNGVGGVQWVASVTDTIPTIAHCETHARIVRDLAVRRRLAAVLARGAAALLSAHSAEEALASVRAALDRVGKDVPAVDDGELAPAADRLFAAMEAASEGRSAGISTGVEDLDSAIGGYFAGDLVFIGADQSRGKTAMALQGVRACAEGGREALVFSYEMPRARVLHRLAQQRSGIGEQQIKTGRVDLDALRAYGRAVTDAQALPIRVYDKGATIEELIARSHARAQKAPLGVVVVDYLQIVRPTPRVDDPTREVARLTRYTMALKQLAMDLEVPVVVLSQFNRVGNKATEPTIHDFKGSGSIESDADVALMLHAADDITTERVVIVGKNRGGARGQRVPLRWSGAHQWLQSPGAEAAHALDDGCDYGVGGWQGASAGDAE